MRTLLLLLLSGAAFAGDLADKLFVVRMTTERASGSGPARQSLAAPALPVGPDGLLLVVGFVINPPEEPIEAIRVEAIAPGGGHYPARLLGGDAGLNCTFFRVDMGKDPFPAPIPLRDEPVARGDSVLVVGLHGEVLGFAARRLRTVIEAAVREPEPLCALEGTTLDWRGSVVEKRDGTLIGFLDLRPTMKEGSGAMLGVGTQTLVVVAASAFADRAAHPPQPRRKESTPVRAREKPWIGVTFAPCDADHEAFFGLPDDSAGAFVTSVAPGSPAARAGLAVFDLVLSIGPLQLRFEERGEFPRLLRDVQALEMGVDLPCHITRFAAGKDGTYAAENRELKLKLAPRPLGFDETEQTEIKDLGFSVRPSTSDFLRSQGLPEDLEGLVATRVEPASAARLGGLLPGDVILEVDRQPVTTGAQLLTRIEEARGAGRPKVAFFVRRGAATTFLAIDLNG